MMMKLREYLLVSESEESLSDLEFDSDNELDDCTLLDIVVNGETVVKMMILFKTLYAVEC
jgi:hypothetical protein